MMLIKERIKEIAKEKRFGYLKPLGILLIIVLLLLLLFLSPVSFLLLLFCFGICSGQIAIKNKAKRITEELHISDKVGKLPETEA